jgi:GxxExxY protein
MELLYGDICSLILKAFYSTYTILPQRLDKSFYTNILLIEMQSLGLKVEKNKKQQIFYKDNLIGELDLDFVVNKSVILKIDNLKGFIEPEQIEESKNYLRLTDFEVLLLLNFGIELDHKRIFITNDFKKQIETK